VLAAAAASGVELRHDAKVTRILRDSGRCTGVNAAGKNFAAGNVVLAAGAYSSGIDGAEPAVAVRPVRGQMAALLNGGTPLRRVLRSDRGYVVPRDDASPQRLVAGSTLENAGLHKAVTTRGLEQIFTAVQELAPSLGSAQVVETWSGLRPDTPDHLPLLGPGDVEGLTFATGHYRNGILLAPITAKLVREWITERYVSLDWEHFNPLRFAAASSGERAARHSV
jgi:glycine oxidase